MERFYFNVLDGASAPDREGVLLPGLDAARIEAVGVLDQSGLTLFMITVITTDSPPRAARGVPIFGP